MASKYDGYWKGRLDAVLPLFQQARDSGQSEALDVRGIASLGSRKSWKGRAVIDRGHAAADQGAVHVTSLAEVLEERCLPSWAQVGSWVLDVSGDLMLTVRQAEVGTRGPEVQDVVPPSKLQEKHFTITDGDTGHTYESIMGPYLEGATAVTIVDPYIRASYQIQNFVRFCETIVKHQTVRRIHLITGCDDDTSRAEAQGKLTELKQSLTVSDVVLTFEWNNLFHNREIRLDNDWTIIIDRGLDFYQRPDSWYGVGANDPSLRKCRQTKVDIYHAKTAAHTTSTKTEVAGLQNAASRPLAPTQSEETPLPKATGQQGNAHTIVLISCVSQKLPYRAPAADLYVSRLFCGSLCYARKLSPDAIYVLSAKYGLVGLDEIIEPYDLTLNDMPAAEIKTWAERVLAQLGKVSDLEQDRFIFLAGQKYRQHLITHIRHYEVPMEGLPIGKQLQFLKKAGC